MVADGVNILPAGRNGVFRSARCQVSGAASMIGGTYYAKFTLQDSTTKVVGGYCICTQAKITDTKGQIAKGTFVFQGNGVLS